MQITKDCSKAVTHEIIVARIAYLTAVMGTQLRIFFPGKKQGISNRTAMSSHLN